MLERLQALRGRQLRALVHLLLQVEVACADAQMVSKLQMCRAHRAALGGAAARPPLLDWHAKHGRHIEHGFAAMRRASAKHSVAGPSRVPSLEVALSDRTAGFTSLNDNSPRLVSDAFHRCVACAASFLNIATRPCGVAPTLFLSDRPLGSLLYDRAHVIAPRYQRPVMAQTGRRPCVTTRAALEARARQSTPVGGHRTELVTWWKALVGSMLLLIAVTQT